MATRPPVILAGRFRGTPTDHLPHSLHALDAEIDAVFPSLPQVPR